ncbi:hypothetical protein OnM2_007016 [Erysiphe neolycopersici]|uniref:Uncharacterized protein n=1 Tax=Erysiphe neolycopersici TaxID=212602 RepID=A0A420I748_9PEZI|nr:hypothetical protein OnM2_007016 [Erysiphe neolycopersici]
MPLYIILLSILGRSKTAHALKNVDAFGESYYGYMCFDRLYPAHVIFAAAKHYCDITKYQPSLSVLSEEDLEYGNKYNFEPLRIDRESMKRESYDIIPILSDGTIYPFELIPERRLTKNSAGEMVKIDPGQERLIVDKNCDIITVFTKLHKKRNGKFKGQNCEFIYSLGNHLSPPPDFSRRPSVSTNGLPEQLQEKSHDSSDLSKNIKI